MREPLLKPYMKTTQKGGLLKTPAVKCCRLVGGVNLPLIRTLRVWRLRMLTAMLAGTFIITTPELSQTLAMFVKSALPMQPQDLFIYILRIIQTHITVNYKLNFLLVCMSWDYYFKLYIYVFFFIYLKHFLASAPYSAITAIKCL